MKQMEVQKNENLESKENIQTQLQEQYLKNLDVLEDGQLIDGVVVQVTPEQVFVDVGYKSEGKIPISEFSVLPNVGDTVSVVLVTKENKHGEVIVSKQKADAQKGWRVLRQAMKDKTPVEGVITKVVKGGFDVDLNGVHAFLPISQSDNQKVDNPEKLIGLKGQFFVERLYSDHKINVVVNRRKYLEETLDKNRDKFFEEVSIGDTVKGVVKSFTSFGAFIDLGGFDGLLHINDMSWGHVTRPKDFVKKGQEIEVKVVRLDPEEKRINLSIKHFTEDPWLHFEDKYHVNDIVKGKVTKLTDFGAFIELEDGIEGLAHVSEFSWTRKINKPSEVVKIGDEIECMILGYDIQAGRVSLGIKQTKDNPWNTIEEKYPVGTKLTRKVVKITNAGAFIELDEGIDAFLAIEDWSWIKSPKRFGGELTEGQEIEFVVLECSAANRRIRVGVKQLGENPWEKFAAAHKIGSVLEGEVSSITDFGVFVRTEEGVDGLIYRTNLVESKEETFEDAVKKYNVGDKIKVFVTDVNTAKGKLSFSVREVKQRAQMEEMSQYMSSTNDDSDDAYNPFADLLKKN
ncbi:MAG: 30S ribosomal protein S1 [Treponemataceae bacterium]|nr:30S ribosomal protein S1 [Spirochaetales bacterium]MDY6030951.1 30S ribosomal protein S1 [Treponemataceae bacterium]